jgi:hypothetical protein
LNEEYKFRFDKNSDHRSALVIKELPRPTSIDYGLTPFVQVMPEVCKVPGDAVLAYRNFYIREKSRFAKWTKREPPSWYISGVTRRTA